MSVIFCNSAAHGNRNMSGLSTAVTNSRSPTVASPLRVKRTIRHALLIAGSALALAGCKGGDVATVPGPGPDPVPGGSGVLLSYYVASFDPYEALASFFRDSNPKYTVQSQTWTTWWGTIKELYSYPIASSRLEYAHAVGLTGRGETVSIVDGGFRMGHETIAGKISDTTGVIPLDDHGTAVASVIAGESSTMIGVAPEANLHLVAFNDQGDMAAATNAARLAGAVAQNNSWGYEYAPTTGSFNTVFSGADGAAYLAALQAYAAEGVVVFAVSNDQNATSTSILEGLPLLLPELETGWIAVGNAVPVFDDERILSATLNSAGCLEAARWCMVADGTWTAATGTSNSAYDFWVGSSFAAPQVAGALALLAEAFPGLTPHELRIRLLASADNSFFAPDGTIELATGFFHGYSTEYGHGFLDLRAALLPIGVTTLAMANGTRLATEDAIVVTGSAFGDAVSRSLGKFDIAVTDSLSTGFDMPGEALVAPQVPQSLSAGMLSRAVTGDLTRRRIDAAATLDDPFAAFPGKTLDIATPDGSAAASLLVPQAGGEYGLSLKQAIVEGPTRVDLGLKVARNRGSVIGFGGADGAGPGTDLVAVQLGLSRDLGDGAFFSVSGEMGLADVGSPATMSNVSTARFNSIDLSVGQRGVFARGDRLALGLSLPMAVTSGRAEMMLPVARAEGGASFDAVGIDLAPSDRQMDLTVSYLTPLAPGLEMLMEVMHSDNYGNRAGFSETAGVLAMTFRF